MTEPRTASRPSSPPKKGDPSFGQVVYDDLRHARFDRSWLRELQDLYSFYLDTESRSRLAEMGRIKRAFWLLGWLLKSLYLKLAPGRRLLLLLALVLAALGPTAIGGVIRDFDFRPTAFLLLLLILMLELKDKLLARDEIDVARQVQLALFPQEQPHIRGWAVWSYTRPANDVGGDLVDYVDFGGRRFGVVLGDVAGKGLGAALLTAKLQATLRALVPDIPSLDDLGDQLNLILNRDGLDNRFATLFYAELERGGSHVRYLNAGHNPACVVRHDDTEQLGASALPLGMIPTTRYRSGSIDLEPGETLIAYSDGLTEATNDRGEEFGFERLQTLLPEVNELSADRAGARILQEVDGFLEGRRPNDDLSLVVVRRLAPA
jgi:serine phosphatase RsbU (regulator of sigma subunit)